jgi:hypothetical protein
MPRRWQRRRAVNRKSELNELRAELVELRALVAAKRGAPKQGNGAAKEPDVEALIA